MKQRKAAKKADKGDGEDLLHVRVDPGKAAKKADNGGMAPKGPGAVMRLLGGFSEKFRGKGAKPSAPGQKDVKKEVLKHPLPVKDKAQRNPPAQKDGNMVAPRSSPPPFPAKDGKAVSPKSQQIHPDPAPIGTPAQGGSDKPAALDAADAVFSADAGAVVEKAKKTISEKKILEERIIYTVVDQIIEIVESKKSIPIQELSKILNLQPGMIEELAKILDEHGILQLHYPSNPLAHPVLRSVAKHDFKRLGRQD